MRWLREQSPWENDVDDQTGRRGLNAARTQREAYMNNAQLSPLRPLR